MLDCVRLSAMAVHVCVSSDCMCMNMQVLYLINCKVHLQCVNQRKCVFHALYLSASLKMHYECCDEYAMLECVCMCVCVCVSMCSVCQCV